MTLLNLHGGPFTAILADPPWKYDNPRAIVGNGGRGSDGGRIKKIIQIDVEKQYPTMEIDEIKRLPVSQIIHKDAFLFLWATNSFLADGSASEVCRSWGFRPMNILTWGKIQKDGTTPSMKSGHWFRSASEHILFGVHGKPKRPDNFPALPTWQPVERLPHSVKPEIFAKYVELVCPTGPWLEMFARRTRSNWTVWGNEVSK